MSNTDETNRMFNLAVDLVNNTSRNIFLTGKAGTGKTTFLKYIRDNCAKQLAVVAPTGVAAINAGGVTIHSFFQLPFTPFVPGMAGVGNDSSTNAHALLEQLRLNREKKKLIRELELLIIDEISMVRCDTLDAIDTVMRYVRQRWTQPFGGAQVLLIGDMFQLPPVVPEQEWQILSAYYPGPYFFDSQVMQSEPPAHIEFDKIYRQTEEQFIKLLNKVRNNQMDTEAFEILESRFNPVFRRAKDDGYIILTTHNRKADAINELELGKINGRVYTFDAQVDGEFSEKSYPADERLLLKVGAQVMFVKNDAEKVRRYYNGKIGVVTRIEGDKLFVHCSETNTEIEVKQENWDNIRYVVDKKTGKVASDVLGTFTQYPLRLAWAITIHKSQGLTFDKAVIDAGEAFAPGQVYVALSRCTSLNGLILETRIQKGSLSVDPRISAYSVNNHQPAEVEAELIQARKNYEVFLVTGLFDFAIAAETCRSLINYHATHRKSFSDGTNDWLNIFKEQIIALESTGSRFQLQLKQLYGKETFDKTLVDERVRAARDYFTQKLDECINHILTCTISTDSSQHAREMNDDLKEVFALLSKQRFILGGLTSGFSIEAYQSGKRNFKTPSPSINTYGGADNRLETPHPGLYMQLKKHRDHLCSRFDLPIYVVAGSTSLFEMTKYLPQSLAELRMISGFGDAKVQKYGQGFIDIITSFSASKGLTSLIHEKKKNGDKGGSKSKKKVKGDTRKESFNLFRDGRSIAEIASIRNLKVGTIEDHLTTFIEEGQLAVEELISSDKLAVIESAINGNSEESLTKLKVKCGPAISFSEIRMVVAARKFEEKKEAI